MNELGYNKINYIVGVDDSTGSSVDVTHYRSKINIHDELSKERINDVAWNRYVPSPHSWKSLITHLHVCS